MFRRLRSELEGRLRTPEIEGGTAVVPGLALVQQVLDEFGLKHGIDADGDLMVRWENCTMYVFFSGDSGSLLRVRAYVNTWSDVDNRTALTVLLDEWNRTRAMPKAFTVLPDSGKVGICAEHAYDFATGVPREQITFTLGFWIETLLHFAEWVDAEV